MKPEEKAEIILWEWLRTKGKIYFNRINKLNCDKFRVEGERKIPDLVIKLNDGYKIKYYAIEVKSSDKSNNIIQSSKILDLYLKNYLNEKTKYFIGDKEISLNGFLIATDKSPHGHLFKKESWIDNAIKEDGESKYNAATKYKIIPLKEGSRTFEFIRFLWNEYGKFRKNYNKKLDVGIIIGNLEKDKIPYMMITNFNINKKRWGQKWWKL